MKSVVIRTIDDFQMLNDETGEIEFVEYDGVFSFTEDCILPSISFTKMLVFLNMLPLSLEKIYLYDCDTDFCDLKRFDKLKYLKITNRDIDINDLISLKTLEELSLDLCTIKNVELLTGFSNLKELSLMYSDVENCGFLLEMNNLNSIIIDERIYENNKACFQELSKRGVVIGNVLVGDECD